MPYKRDYSAEAWAHALAQGRIYKAALHAAGRTYPATSEQQRRNALAHKKRWPAANAARSRRFFHQRRALGKLPPVAALGNACIDCGETMNLTVGHLLPVVLGGTNDRANVARQCRSCNSRQGVRPHRSLSGG